jgi:hypothetical protein
MRNISMIPLLSIGGAGVFATPTSQQGFGADDFKAKASALPRKQFHQPVQTFRVASGISISKIVENGISPAFGCQHQGKVCIEDRRRDLFLPCKIAIPCFTERGSFVHLEKRFLLRIGECQVGKVSQPRLHDQALFFVQIVGASEQQIPIVHQRSALFVCQTCSYLFANGFKAGVKQLHKMELVHDQMSVRQDLKYGVMVGLPHIGANDLDVLLHHFRQALQIPNYGFFTPISQKIDHAVVFHIRDHTTVLVQQIQFVYPQASDWCTCPVWFQVNSELAEQQANACLCQSYFVSDTHKGSMRCLLVDVVDQAARAKVVLVHIGNRLKESSVTATAPEAAAQDRDAYALASDGQVHVELGFDFVSVELLVFTESTTKRRKETFRLNVQVMFVFVYCQDTKACQFENIQQPLSLHQELPSKFFYSRANLVLEKAELSDKFPTVSTHFCDVEHSGRGVKIGSIPRTFAISQFLGKKIS